MMKELQPIDLLKMGDTNNFLSLYWYFLCFHSLKIFHDFYQWLLKSQNVSLKQHSKKKKAIRLNAETPNW